MTTHRQAVPHERSTASRPTGFSCCVALRDELERAAPGWLGARLAESDIVAALPRFDECDGGWATVWQAALPPLSGPEATAETLLSRACAAAGMLGVGPGGFVNAPVPEQSVPGQPVRRIADPAAELGAMRALGWASRHLHQAGHAADAADDLRRRVTGAAGWLVTRPEFLTERDTLRDGWAAVSEFERPPLPLRRSVRLDHPPPGGEFADESPPTAFQRLLDRFCDRWRLLGMTTWNLPHPEGPLWAEGWPVRPGAAEGSEAVDTPWHFPLLDRDGLGELLGGRHRSRARNHGFTDQGRWETYARLLAVDFWERVARSRSSDRPRPRAFVSRLDPLLGDLAGCNAARVPKLRSELAALRTGRRSSPGARL